MDIERDMPERASLELLRKGSIHLPFIVEECRAPNSFEVY